MKFIWEIWAYSDDPTYNQREIDIECSRWANVNNSSNSQFVVQPSTTKTKTRYIVPSGITNSTHFFTWNTNGINFQSQRGSYSLNQNPTNVIASWTCTNGLPRTGDENIHINLWLDQGQPPTDGKEVEVIIKSFQFVPLASPPLLQPTMSSTSSGKNFHFTINSQPDRQYQVTLSTNLVDWQNLATILATNIAIDFTDTNSTGASRRFYQITSLP